MGPDGSAVPDGLTVQGRTVPWICQTCEEHSSRKLCPVRRPRPLDAGYHFELSTSEGCAGSVGRPFALRCAFAPIAGPLWALHGLLVAVGHHVPYLDTRGGRVRTSLGIVDARRAAVDALACVSPGIRRGIVLRPLPSTPQSYAPRHRTGHAPDRKRMWPGVLPRTGTRFPSSPLAAL